MKKYIYPLLVISAIVLISCSEPEKEIPVEEGAHLVEVKESMNASSYSYLLVEEKGEEYWIAVPQMAIEPGEKLKFSKSLEMLNFPSPSLNRTFDRILFVEDAVKPAEVKNDIPLPHTQVKAAGKQDIKVTPVEGGVTIEKIYADKNELNGKSVVVKGIVTRFNEDIMDRNWIHLQDGTGSDNNYDLMITTSELTEVGKEIIVEGKVATDKDFGYGYSYSVMIENGKIKSK